jgi:hypothetical protein
MRPIYFTTNTHTQITLPAKQLILALLVIRAIPKVQYWLLAYRLAIMLTRNLILVMLEVTFFTEVGLLGEAKVGCHHV